MRAWRRRRRPAAENVVVTKDANSKSWIPKLTGFGWAIDLEVERAVLRAGSRGYMAPEVEACPHSARHQDIRGLSAYGTDVDVSSAFGAAVVRACMWAGSCWVTSASERRGGAMGRDLGGTRRGDLARIGPALAAGVAWSEDAGATCVRGLGSPSSNAPRPACTPAQQCHALT